MVLHHLLELLSEAKSNRWMSDLVWLGTCEPFETEHGATAHGKPYSALCRSDLCMLCSSLLGFLLSS